MNRLRAFLYVKSHVVSKPSAALGRSAVSPLVFVGSRGMRSSESLCKDRTTMALPKDAAGLVKRLLRRAGWLDHSRGRLRMTGHLLYENVADRVDYPRFFEEFDMLDTFLSWFVITELHVWMLMVRAMAEGKEGKCVRNALVQALWGDAEVRAKKLEKVSPVAVREQLAILSQEFQASLFSYDEGLLTNDRILAGALWRRFFQLNCSNPQYLESLVQFVRQQVKIFDVMPREQILLRPDVKWISFQKPSLIC